MKKNTYVGKGIAGIPELMVTPRLAGFEKIVNDNYRPLSLVMFAAEYQFFGANPFIGHLFNLLFFAGCVVLLFLFTDRLFQGKQTGIALIAALLFALHPIHTEVVANIKSRDEIMCFFFALASLITFLKFADTGKPLKLWMGAVLLMLAFLSKENVISFLVIIPVVFLVYYSCQRNRRLWIISVSCLVSLSFLFIRYEVLKGHDSSAIPFLDNPLVTAHYFSERLPTAIFVLGKTLKLLVVPYPLVCDYSYNSIPVVGWGNLWVLCSLAVYVSMLVLVIRRFLKKSPDPLTFGIIFYFANLALFSNILFTVYSEMAERLMFFASAGFCIMLAALIFEGAARVGVILNDKLPVKLLYLLVPVSLVFAVITFNRNGDWKSNYDLFSTDIKKMPENARLWHSYGSILLFPQAEIMDDTVDATQRTKDGLAAWYRSIAIYNDNFKVHLDLGNYYRGNRQYDSAEKQLKEAYRLLPGSPVVVSDLGYVYFCEQKYTDALTLAKSAMIKDNKNALIYNNIGMCYVQMQVYDSALQSFKRTLQLDPENAMAKEYIGKLTLELKNRDTLKMNK